MATGDQRPSEADSKSNRKPDGGEQKSAQSGFSGELFEGKAPLFQRTAAPLENAGGKRQSDAAGLSVEHKIVEALKALPGDGKFWAFVANMDRGGGAFPEFSMVHALLEQTPDRLAQFQQAYKKLNNGQPLDAAQIALIRDLPAGTDAAHTNPAFLDTARQAKEMLAVLFADQRIRNGDVKQGGWSAQAPNEKPTAEQMSALARYAVNHDRADLLSFTLKDAPKQVVAEATAEQTKNKLLTALDERKGHFLWNSPDITSFNSIWQSTPEDLRPLVQKKIEDERRASLPDLLKQKLDKSWVGFWAGETSSRVHLGDQFSPQSQIHEAIGNIKQGYIGGAYTLDLTGWVRNEEKLVLTNAAAMTADELQSQRKTGAGKAEVDTVFDLPQVSGAAKDALKILLNKDGGYTPEKIAALTDIAAQNKRMDIAELALHLGKLQDDQAKARLLAAFPNEGDRNGLSDLIANGHKSNATLTEANEKIALMPRFTTKKSEITRLADAADADEQKRYMTDPAYKERMEKAWQTAGTPADVATWRAKFLKQEPFTGSMLEFGQSNTLRGSDNSYLLEAEDRFTPKVAAFFKDKPAELDRLQTDLRTVYSANETAEIMKTVAAKMKTDVQSDAEFAEVGRRPVEQALASASATGDKTIALMRMTNEELSRLMPDENGKRDDAYLNKLKELASSDIERDRWNIYGTPEKPVYDVRRDVAETAFALRYLDKAAAGKDLDPVDIVYMAAAAPGKPTDSIRAIELALKDPQVLESVKNPKTDEDRKLSETFHLALEGAVINRQTGTFETAGRLAKLGKYGQGVPDLMMSEYDELLKTGHLPLEKKMWFAHGALEQTEVLMHEASKQELQILANKAPVDQKSAEWRDSILGSQYGLFNNKEKRNFLENWAEQRLEQMKAAGHDHPDTPLSPGFTMADLLYARHLDGTGFPPGQQTDRIVDSVSAMPKEGVRLMSAEYFAKYGRNLYDDVMTSLEPEQKLRFGAAFKEAEMDPRQRYLEASRLQVDTTSPLPVDWLIRKFDGTKEGARDAMDRVLPLVMEHYELLKQMPPDAQAEYRRQLESGVDKALQNYQNADANYANSVRLVTAMYDVATAALFSAGFAAKFFQYSYKAYMANLKGWGLKTYVGLTMPVEMYLQGSNYGPGDATMALLGNTFAMAKPHWLLHTLKLHPKLATNTTLAASLASGTSGGLVGMAQAKYIQMSHRQGVNETGSAPSALFGVGFDDPDEPTVEAAAIAARLSDELRRRHRH